MSLSTIAQGASSVVEGLFRAAMLAGTLAASACVANQPPQTIPVSTSARPQRASGPAEAARAVRELRTDLGRVFGAPIMNRGVWGIDIRSLDTGERLYSLNAGKLMMPASNMKILTLAAAAEVLGWDFRFTTALETGGTVIDGVLHGDVVVRSNGDPSINAREERADAVLSGWARALQAAGISSIDGRILGDDQAFDDDGLGAGWAWDYLQYGYAAPVGALEFNENTAVLTISPGPAAGDTVILNLTPGTGFTLLNRAVTGAADSADTIDYRRHIDRAALEVTGSIPAGTPEATRIVAVVNPTVFFAQAVKDGLTARGIAVTGQAADLDDVAAEIQAHGPPERRVLVSTESPPLREIATILMKVSQNLYAETLLKALGAARGGLGTAEGGRIAVRATLDGWGVPRDAYVMFDGSGLSRYNYVTAETLTSVLERMYRDPRHREAFVATLPIAGKDGTIAARLRRTRAEGNAVAKTGSISNVRALSGFVRTRDGEMLVFAILSNDFVIPAATVNWIADLGVEILSNFTRR
jgi:D-alanyl-D-alanine carboxypeptidase/D-alanyl-D-alanine-endopeptidase (penicillin-binding protein 4)